MEQPSRIGVLCVQGGFSEHMDMLRRVGAEGVDVRLPQHLDRLDGLIIPGGESTTIGLVARGSGLIDAVKDFISKGRPVYGTCAGLIVLCNGVEGQKEGGQSLFGGLRCTCSRNGFGRQVNSFEQRVDVAASAAMPVRPSGAEVFIRAPAVTRVDGPGVDVLATVRHRLAGAAEEADVVVAVRQGPILATSFHPELTDDPAWHSYFAAMVADGRRAAAEPTADGARGP